MPYYAFQGSLVTYSLDTVLIRGDTFTFRFGIPAPQGHSYEVSLNWNMGKINYARYIGQSNAGGFMMCRAYAGRQLGSPINLNHVQPAGQCFEMYPEFEEIHFIGRGISTANNRQLIVVDADFRQLRRYQLRYRIRSIEAGDEFYVILEDANLKSAAEVPVRVVISNKRYCR